MLLFCPENSIIEPEGSPLTCLNFCVGSAPRARTQGGTLHILVPFFLKESPDWTMGCWKQISPGGTRTKRGEKGGFYFVKEHQCQQTSPREEGVMFCHHQTDILFFSPRCVTVTKQYTHGAQNKRAQKLPPFTSYVRHHDSGKNRHSIISTTPPT